MFLNGNAIANEVALHYSKFKITFCASLRVYEIIRMLFLFQDDRYFLSGSLDGKIRLWNIPDKKVALWNEVEGTGK